MWSVGYEVVVVFNVKRLAAITRGTAALALLTLDNMIVGVFQVG